MFSAIEIGAEDPTSNPARQLVLSESEGLVERLHTLYNRVQQQAASVNEQMTSLTSRVSSLASGIADLNGSITRELAAGNGAQPNGLLDARDELLRQLTEIVAVRTSTETGGAISVFVGNGQPIVIGSLSNRMGVQPSATDAEILDITFIGLNDQPIPITNSVTGGALGGLLEFRDDVLESTLNSLGRITLAMTDSLNQQNQQGLDLDGNFGSLIFEDINASQVMALRSKTLAGSAALDVSITDVSSLSTDNYLLTITDVGPPELGNLVNQTSGEIIAGSFIATDQDNNAATPDVNLFTPTDPTKTEGLAIYVNSGALALNDQFSIRPTRSAASDVAIQMSRVQELAFAAPIVTDAELSNSGGSTISPGYVLEAFDRFGNAAPAFVTPGQLTPPISITFTSATTYDVFDSSTGPATLLFSGNFVQGQSNAVFSTDPTILPPALPPAAAPFYLGYQVELGGNPVIGDTFTIGFNSTGVSDNRNAVAMGELRVTGILEGGEVNFEGDYGRLVEELGAETSQNRVSRESSYSLLQTSINNRAAVSGVNLDEEAANLIRFEQAYSASAQVITVARQIFETMLNTFR